MNYKYAETEVTPIRSAFQTGNSGEAFQLIREMIERRIKQELANTKPQDAIMMKMTGKMTEQKYELIRENALHEMGLSEVGKLKTAHENYANYLYTEFMNSY